jgi:integrase
MDDGSKGDETNGIGFSNAGAMLLAEAQQNGGREASKLARRRYQHGSLRLVGKRERKWEGRWLEDELQPEGSIRRVHRSEILGTLREMPTKRLALRELEARLQVVNSPTYRARPSATFAQFATRWETTILSQHKPSTQATIRGHLKKYLVPAFGEFAVRDVGPERVQQFIAGLRVNPKTVRNMFVTLQMMWKSARAWGYVTHDALEGVVLPKRRRPQQFFFTVEEVQRILAAADEPYHTFYWLAAETGMRAGELCGLRVDDLELERCLVHIRQSAWHGKLQDPKTENAVRAFALSPRLGVHLAEHMRGWRPNERRLLFATRNGTPWDANLLVKRKLRPLLRSLGIERGGLHAFRHANSSLMDRLGAPLKVRQQRLGHSDPRLTLGVYTHVASEDDARIAERLGELLGGIPCRSLPELQKEGAAPNRQPLLS